MRILHLVHDFPPDGPGGTQEYVAGLAELQRAAGHAVAVIAGARESFPGGGLRQEQHRGTHVWRVLRDLPLESHSGDLGNARIGAQLEGLAERFAPDLVHLHHWHALTCDAVRRLRARGWPVVVTLHDLFTTCPRHFRMPDYRSLCPPDADPARCVRCLEREVPEQERGELAARLAARALAFGAELGAAKRVLAVSEAQARLLVRLGRLRPAELEVEPIGIRVTRPAPTGWRAQPGRLRLVNWGGLDPRKGPHVLLAALARCERRAAFSLELFGRAAEREYQRELEQLARGLDVHFRGAFRDEERWRFGAAFDLAVFPFLAFETHALVVDEALHAGLPVLVSDRGAPSARLGGRGLAVAPEPEELARALEELLAEPERLAAMRAAPHGATELGAHVRALERHYAAALMRN